MPWKWRGGRAYYYRSERVGDRVVSRYVGRAGSGAELIAEIDAVEREIAETRRQDERAERRRLADHEGEMAALAAESRSLVAWALRAAGYRQHAGGHWRKRRMGRRAEAIERAPVPVPPPTTTSGLMRKAGRIEAAVAHRMMAWGKGDDAEDPRSRGRDETAELVRDEVHRFAEQLAGSPDAPPIVRATSHIASVAYHDWCLSRFVAERPDPPPAMARAIERAEKRWCRAAKTLHELQRRLPDVMVAIGQVNIAAVEGFRHSPADRTQPNEIEHAGADVANTPNT